jgi:hypothetical protein
VDSRLRGMTVIGLHSSCCKRLSLYCFGYPGGHVVFLQRLPLRKAIIVFVQSYFFQKRFTLRYIVSHHIFLSLMQRKIFFLLLTLALVILFHTAHAKDSQKEEVHFSDIIITTSKTHLLLFGLINNGITEEMLQGLHNGIPIRFTFLVELDKTEKNWSDLQLISLKFQHILTYDTLQENYRVETSEKKQKSESFSQLSDALKTMTEINGLLVVELSQLVPDGSYQLRLKAELYKKSLPMKLDYILPFVSWWDVETDWHTIEFTY